MATEGQDDKDMLVDLLTQKLDHEKSRRMRAEEHAESLQNKLQRYSSYISRMKTGLMSRLEVAECQAQNVIDSHSSRLQEANLTVTQLKSELEAVRKQYEAENRRLNTKIQEIQAEQKASIKAISDDLAQVQHQRNSLFAEVNGLRNKIKSANQAAAEAKLTAETMKEREEILTNTANQSAALLKQAQQKAETQKARAENLNTLLGQLRKRLSESENNRLKALESLKLMTEKSVAADSSIASAKRRCEAAIARADQLNEQLQASNKKAKEELIGYEKEVSRLKQLLSAARGDAEKWEHKFENAQTKVQNLSTEIAKASQSRQSAEQKASTQLKEEKTRVAELQKRTTTLKNQIADLQKELSARQKEAAEALQAGEERIKTLESRIELDLKPLLDVANVRGDTLSNEVDTLSQERDVLFLRLTEHHCIQNGWEAFLADIGVLVDILVGTLCREEDVVKQEMSRLQSANGRLEMKLNDDKEFIENLMADNEALRNSLKGQTAGLELSSNEIANLQTELTKVRSALAKVTEERDAALASLHQAEKNISEQQETFCKHIKEIEHKLNQRDFETKGITQRPITNMESEAAKRMRENQRITDAVKRSVPAFGLNDMKRRRAFQPDSLQEAKQQITHLKAELAERNIEVARLEALVQERTAFVETRAAELAELQEAVRKQMVNLQEKLKNTSEDVEEKKKQLKSALLANKTTLERLNRAKMENERLARRVDNLTNENRNLKEQLEVNKRHYDELLTPEKVTDLIHDTVAASRSGVDSTPQPYLVSVGEIEANPAKKASSPAGTLFNRNHEALQSQNRFSLTNYRKPSLEMNKWHVDSRITGEVYARRATEKPGSQPSGEMKTLNLGSPVGGSPKATSGATAAPPPNQSQGCSHSHASPRRSSGGDVVAAAHGMDRLPTTYRVINPLHSPDSAKLRQMIATQEKSPFHRVNKT